MPNIMGVLLTPVINSVRKSADSFNGRCTWKFSQIQDPVATLIGKEKLTKDGICEMLAAKWIECHAKDDHLANWLQGRGKEIDPSKIRQLMQLFIIGSEMSPGAIIGSTKTRQEADQTQATKNWLRAKGLIERNGGKFRFEQSRGGGGSRSGHAADLAQAVAMSLLNGTGSYRTIGIWGSGGGHAMAAWVAQDVAFFDPNFGEFWFERRQDFIRWFPTFFSKSLYSMPKVGLCTKYEIMDFAMSVKPRR